MPHQPQIRDGRKILMKKKNKTLNKLLKSQLPVIGSYEDYAGAMIFKSLQDDKEQKNIAAFVKEYPEMAKQLGIMTDAKKDKIAADKEEAALVKAADDLYKQQFPALTALIEQYKLEATIKKHLKEQNDSIIKSNKDLAISMGLIPDPTKAANALAVANQEKNALFDNQITIQEKLIANDEKWMQVQEKLTVAQNEFDIAGQAAAQEELNAVKKESISLKLQEVDQETRAMILKENRAVLDGRQTELQAEQNIIDTQRNQLAEKYFGILHSDDPDKRLSYNTFSL